MISPKKLRQEDASRFALSHFSLEALTLQNMKISIWALEFKK